MIVDIIPPSFLLLIGAVGFGIISFFIKGKCGLALTGLSMLM